MKLSRRSCLQIGGASLAGAALVGCNPIANRIAPHPPEAPLPTGDIRPEVRLLNRAGFGPRPGDLSRVKSQGFDNYLAELIAAKNPEPISLLMQVQREDVSQLDDSELEDLPRAEVIRQLQQSALLRAVYGENQLEERMVDFWSNHFNVFALKGDSAFRKGLEEREVIRTHALGRFQDLLFGSARSAAMLAFLDNPQNLYQHPNENYARELMELHTLGIGGGYTQRDVQEVARCFTGWTLETRFLRPRGKLRFDPDHHDDGPKRVLGHLIATGGGEQDAHEVLSILAAHPATSRFIAKKMVDYFHGDADSGLVEKVSKVYRETGGDLRSMVRPLLDPKVLLDAPPRIKRPFDLTVSTIRATGGDTDGNNGVQEHLIAMGEPVYEWPMPDGYPTKTSAWAGSMLPRWNFAHAFAHDEIRGTGPGTVHHLLDDLIPLDAVHHPQLEASDNSKLEMALTIASPEFQWT